VLNVEQANQPARRVYQRLGFRLHCEFVWSEVEKP
jgi:predicted GNAT family acetyltransferase